MNDSLSPPAALPAATAPESIPTSRPAGVPPDASFASRARVAEGLTEPCARFALDAVGDCGAGRAARANGWTSDRMRVFLNALADCGVVEDAARAAGMTRQGAYALRNRAGCEDFQLAWNAALVVARGRLADEVMSRALNGCVELIYRNGEIVAERHRHDNRLAMAVLSRLDAQASDEKRESRMVNHVAREFDDFVEIIAEGEDGEAAAFLEEREDARSSLDSETIAMLRRAMGEAEGEGEEGAEDENEADAEE
jgi:hypothetical protein